MKRCTKDKELKKSSSKSGMKKCSTKLKSEMRSWADLDLDLVGEIKKKLYFADHVRFGGVCKTWLAAQHEKRAADVLPLLFLFDEDERYRIHYNLYEPLNLHQPIISEIIDLNQFFDTSTLHFSLSVDYMDGCLFLSVSNIDYTCTHFLIYSIPTHKALPLPQFKHSQAFSNSSTSMVLKAVSTYPAHPDCVFLALHVANDHQWSIAIFRNGDTQWTTTDFDFPEPFGQPLHMKKAAVFVRGVFYFLCFDQRLASYDIASKELKVETFSPPVDYSYRGIYEFFGLDGDLMLMYYDYKVCKCFLTTYDWSQKLWVPLKNLGDRSLFLSPHSAYLDAINYYGVSPNKIYLQRHGICCVYSFENGELEPSSSGLRYWSDLKYPSKLSMWIEPPDLLPK